MLSRLNIRPTEQRLVILLMIHSFFVGVPRIFAATTANTLFLNTYGAGLLPLIYIASAVLNPLIGLIFAQIGRRMSFHRFLLMNLILQLISLIIFRVLFGLTDNRASIFAFSMWFEVLWVLSSLQFWGLAGRLFDLRQGKRLFALIGSGEVIAFMVIGLAGGTIINIFGVENLLIFAILGVIGSLYMAHYIMTHYANALQQFESAGGTRRVSHGFYRNSYVLLIIGLAAAAYMAFFFVDNVFYTQVELQFDNQEAIARFLIGFAAVSGLVNLIVRVVFSERLINRFGVQGGLLALPLLLFVGAVGVTGSGIFGLSIVFAFAAFTKLTDQVMRYSIHRSSLLILYQPLPQRDQVRAQSLVESIVEPITGGITGVLLLVLVNALMFDTIGLYALLLAVLGLWLGIVFIISQSYREMVLNALRKRRIDGHTLSFQDASSMMILVEKLDSPYPAEVIYAVNMLDTMNHPDIEALLIRLLQYRDRRVRRDVLERIERRRMTQALTAVEILAHKESDIPTRAQAVRTLAGLSNDEAFNEMLEFLESPRSDIQLAAMTGLLRYGGIEGVLNAGNRLLKMIASPAEGDRIMAAHVLGEVGMRNFYRPLLTLLHDPEPEVRTAALMAAGKLRNPALWQLCIDNLRLSKTRTAAVVALSNADEAIIPDFAAAFEDDMISPRTLMEIIRIAGRIKGEKMQAFLISQSLHPNLNVRLEVLKALAISKYTTYDQAVIDKAVQAEVENAAWTMNTLQEVKGIGAELLRGALQKEFEQTIERIFYWLSFIYPDAMRIKANLDQRAYALEAIDQMLHKDLKPLIMPLLDDLSDEERLQQLSVYYPQRKISAAERIRQILKQQRRWFDPWLRATAVYTATKLEMEQDIIPLVNDPDPLVAETALWALKQLSPDLYRAAIIGITAQQSGARTSQILKTTMAILAREEKGGRPMLLTIEKVIILKGVNIFAETPEEFLAEIAFRLTEVEVDPGEVIIQQGEAANCMYIIVEGEIKVHNGDQTIATMTDRDFFGELALLDDEPRSATITAIVNTHLLRLSREDFHEIIHDYPEIARGIMRVLSARLRRLLEEK